LRLLLHQCGPLQRVLPSRRADLIVVGRDIGRLHLVIHDVYLGARVVISIGGVLVLELNLGLLELARFDLQGHSLLPVDFRLLDKLVLAFVLLGLRFENLLGDDLLD
jgi:hypothetical protein